MTEDRISAQEIRAMGFSIDPTIPDCATIARKSMRIINASPVPATADKASRTMTLSLAVELTEPFEWVTLNVPLDDEPTPPQQPPRS